MRVVEEGDRTALTAYGPTQRRCKRSNENLEEGDAAAAAAAQPQLQNGEGEKSSPE